MCRKIEKFGLVKYSTCPQRKREGKEENKDKIDKNLYIPEIVEVFFTEIIFPVLILVQFIFIKRVFI